MGYVPPLPPDWQPPVPDAGQVLRDGVRRARTPRLVLALRWLACRVGLHAPVSPAGLHRMHCLLCDKEFAE